MALKKKLLKIFTETKQLGKDDPRRIIHAFKVGFAITLVSLLNYWDPFDDTFGSSATWAVFTVIVVFEFSVGATLGKGLNRGLATFLAGGLGFGAHFVANLGGRDTQPVLIGGFVFLIATVVTFVRFFPRMKAKYDYGLLIFILTFCLVAVSGNHGENVLVIANWRVSTILIGGFTAVCVCVFIRPVWAGSDLHKLVADNIEKLSLFLETFAAYEYEDLKYRNGDITRELTLQQGYKKVLNSKQTEDSLANFAGWEPRHGKFRFRHPWKQYLKVADLTRQCAYRVEALHKYYLTSEIQATPEIFQGEIREACAKISLQCGIALRELAQTLRNMRLPLPPSDCPRIAKVKTSAELLKIMLKLVSCEDIDLLDIIPAATVASLLLEIASSTEEISKSVRELARLTRFEPVEQGEEASKDKPESIQIRTMQRSKRINKLAASHVVTIE